jgi:tetratricopeptide (TPR) repeat protein
MTRPTHRRRPPTPGGPAQSSLAVHGPPATVGWLATPSAWILARLLLFGLAAAWRLAYLARLGHTPFAGSLDADSRIYWSWSEVILRHGLWPPAPFFLAPLYPYVLAGWRALGAGGIPQILAIQSVLGAAAVVLLADATARLAGRWPALAVGVLLALHQSTTFFDGLVLPESLLFLLESLLVWFVARTDWSRAGFGPFAAYGLLVAALAQGRASNALLLALVIPLAGTRGADGGHRLRAAALAVAMFAVACLPSAIANDHAARELIPFTYNLGFNLYVGNNPEADGAWVDVTMGSTPVALEGTSPVTGGALDGRAFLLASQRQRLSPAESSARWAQMAAEFVRSAPARTLALAGRKLLLAWTWREIPQIEAQESWARAAGPLGLPILGTFGCFAILGLSGAAWGSRRGAAGRWMIGYVGLITLSLVPFFVTDRYRHHLLPGLAVLAGVAIAEITRAARGAERASRARTALAVGLAAGVVLIPIGSRRVRSGEWVFESDRAIRWLDRGAYAEAAAGFARAESELGDVQEQTLSSSARVDLAAFHFRYAIALEGLGRHEDAIAHWERALALDPNDVESLGRLYVAYDLTGRTSEADRARRRLQSLPGGRGRLLLDEAWSTAGRGDLASAERLFLEALHASPDLAMAWTGLLRLRVQAGRFDDAARGLDDARGAGLDPLTADIFECFLAVRRGETARARRILGRIPADAPPPDPFLEGLLAESRRALAESAGH